MELKAIKRLADESVAPLLAYWRSSRVERGPLLNFSSPKFELEGCASGKDGEERDFGEFRSPFLRLLRLFAAKNLFRF